MFVNKFIVGTLVIPFALLAGCKQELPKQVTQDAVFGTVQNIRSVSDEKQLVYQSGEDPYQKNWGLAGGYYVTVDGKDYQLNWDQADKVKELKVGDKVNLHASEYIACVGEAELKPNCRRLMRVYKSERRLNPLVTP